MILITIGRNKDNRYVIDDPQKRLSGYHAEIKVGDDNSITILDHSLNGTTVNGRRIDKEVEVQLNRGAEVIFGGVAKLDWNRIPVLPPVAPGTKLFSIGTHLTNRIMINDGSNMVSRYHATLKIAPNGKMTISDHSANGTFVNGSRIPSNQDIPVKRRDKILFANATPLDWSRIPGVKLNPWYIVAPIAAVLVVGLLITSYILSWPPFGNLSPEKIFAKYEKSVVVIRHYYQVIAELKGGEGDIVLQLGTDDKLFLSDGTKLLCANEGSFYNIENVSAETCLLLQGGDGTAFFINNKGLMLTNRHITMPWEPDMKKYEVAMEKEHIPYKRIYGKTYYIGYAMNNTDVNKISDFTECAILSINTDDSRKDIGLLRTKNRQLPNPDIEIVDLNRAMIDQNKLKEGQNVYVLGYPLGVNHFVATNSGTTNTVQVKLTCQPGAINQTPDGYKFGLNAQMTHGASGSPVFNGKGQLIGVFNSGFDVTQGLNFAILAKHAKKLYEDANE